MAWNNTNNIVKHNGQCWNKGKYKYCSFWKARCSKEGKKSVIGYICSLFDQDKSGYNSLPECNKKYGITYDGIIIVD